MDADGSGRISYPELKHSVRELLRMSPIEMPEARLKGLWRALDDDSSGFLSTGEFGKFMRSGESVDARWGTAYQRQKVQTARDHVIAENKQKRAEQDQRLDQRVRGTLVTGASSTHTIENSTKYEFGGRAHTQLKAREGEKQLSEVSPATAEQVDALSRTINARFATYVDLFRRGWFRFFQVPDPPPPPKKNAHRPLSQSMLRALPCLVAMRPWLLTWLTRLTRRGALAGSSLTMTTRAGLLTRSSASGCGRSWA